VRTRLDLDERREQLIAIGTELFSARAYDEISIDDIAAAAGISKGLLYHYFPSKRHFYVATVRASADELRRVTEPEADVPPLERMRHSMDRYLDYVEHHAEGYATLLRGGIGSDVEVRAIVDDTRQAFVERVLSQVSPGAPAGAVLRHTVRGWVGFVEAVSLEWLDHRELDRTAMRDLLVGTLVHTLSAAVEVDPTIGELTPLRT
jgi:AcrR family transcriptional regulator